MRFHLQGASLLLQEMLKGPVPRTAPPCSACSLGVLSRRPSPRRRALEGLVFLDYKQELLA
eukprot:2151413-Pyramimonas_sp.AAC.1